MLSLKKDYIRVTRASGLSYGGSQMWAGNETIRNCGCGPVAALDTLLYLTGRQDTPIPFEEYNEMLSQLCRKYFPLINPFGINGLFLAIGMNRLLRKHHLPYRAFWAVSGNKFWERIEELLQEDVPVIFSIGPNFPQLWKKHRLPLYDKKADGSYVRSGSAVAHYVCATGLDEDYLRISSWGAEYYIKRDEYRDYVKKHSAALVSNILMLRKIK